MNDRGQSTVELALATPLICLLVCGLVQVGVVVRDQIAVQLAAREAARSAAISSDPQTAAALAARQSTTLTPLDVDVSGDAYVVTASVRYVEHTDMPLIGMFLPDVELTASASMASEPP